MFNFRLALSSFLLITCLSTSARAAPEADGYRAILGTVTAGNVYAFGDYQRLIALEDSRSPHPARAACIDWFLSDPPRRGTSGGISTTGLPWQAPRALTELGLVRFTFEGGQTAIWRVSEIASLRTGTNFGPTNQRAVALSGWIRQQSIDVGLLTLVAREDGDFTAVSVEDGELRITVLPNGDLTRLSAGISNLPWSTAPVPVERWLGAAQPGSRTGILLAAADTTSGQSALTERTNLAAFRRAASLGRYYGTSTDLVHAHLNNGAILALSNRRTLSERRFDRNNVRLEVQSATTSASVPQAVEAYARRVLGLTSTAADADVVMLIADGTSDISGQLARIGNLRDKVVILVSCVGHSGGLSVESARRILRAHHLAAIAIYDGPVDAERAIDSIHAAFNNLPPDATWDDILTHLMTQSPQTGARMGVILSRLTLISRLTASA